jgi:hypothetical protein
MSVTLDMRCDALRDLVCNQLVNTWVARILPSSREEVSQKTGLSVDLLRDIHIAWAEKRIEETGTVYTNLSRGKTRNTYAYHFLGFASSADFEFLRDHIAETRQAELPTFVMSLLHHYLLQTEWEPSLYKKWLVKGKWLSQGHAGYTKEIWKFKVYLTQASLVALTARASYLRMPRATLVRSILCSVLNNVDGEGFGAVGSFRYISKRQMFSDVSRYKMPSSTVDSEQDEAE